MKIETVIHAITLAIMLWLAISMHTTHPKGGSHSPAQDICLVVLTGRVWWYELRRFKDFGTYLLRSSAVWNLINILSVSSSRYSRQAASQCPFPVGGWS